MSFSEPRRATIGFIDDEVLTFDLDAPDGECSVCRRELDDDDQRLTLEIAVSGLTFTVRICRACLGEHAPGLLEAILE